MGLTRGGRRCVACCEKEVEKIWWGGEGSGRYLLVLDPHSACVACDGVACY